LIGVAVLAVVLIAAGCGADESEDGTDGTSEGMSGICAEGAEDCDDTVTEDDVPLDTPVECVDTAACEAQSRDIAVRDLSAEVQAGGDEITVVSTEPMQWPDACLGVSTPGTVCAQVITPGFKIVLEHDGTQYEYHSDMGTRAVLVR
jgi:hypothetical protein